MKNMESMMPGVVAPSNLGRMADTAEKNAQDIINTDGLVVIDRFEQKKAHPLLPAIRDSRAQKMAALKALCLDLEPLRDRPGRPGGK